MGLSKDPIQEKASVSDHKRFMKVVGSVVIYMHTMHAWLTVRMLWQMHGRTLQAVHMLIVCMGIFSSVSPPSCGDCTGLCT